MLITISQHRRKNTHWPLGYGKSELKAVMLSWILPILEKLLNTQINLNMTVRHSNKFKDMFSTKSSVYANSTDFRLTLATCWNVSAREQYAHAKRKSFNYWKYYLINELIKRKSIIRLFADLGISETCRHCRRSVQCVIGSHKWNFLAT